MTTTATELRAEAQLCRQAAAFETAPEVKQLLAARALVLAQLAEKMENDAYRGATVGDAEIERWKGSLLPPLDGQRQALVERALARAAAALAADPPSRDPSSPEKKNC